MIGPYTIDHEALYDDAALSKALGLSRGAMERARRAGKLRFTRNGGRVLYLGAWVLDWLVADESRQRQGVGA